MEMNVAIPETRTVYRANLSPRGGAFVSVVAFSLAASVGLVRLAVAKESATQPADGSILLGTANSRIHGFQLHIERKPQPHFVYWVDPQEYIEWPHGCVQAGKFYVELTYSCVPMRGGTLYLRRGRRRLAGHADQTGGWNKWRTYTLGEITIAQEKTTAFLKADGNPQNALMDVMRVRLIPLPK